MTCIGKQRLLTVGTLNIKRFTITVFQAQIQHFNNRWNCNINVGKNRNKMKFATDQKSHMDGVYFTEERNNTINDHWQFKKKNIMVTDLEKWLMNVHNIVYERHKINSEVGRPAVHNKLVWESREGWYKSTTFRFRTCSNKGLTETQIMLRFCHLEVETCKYMSKLLILNNYFEH